MTDSAPPPTDDRFVAAVRLAAMVHHDQVRKGTTIPYVSHPLAVASLVLEHGGGEDAACAAVLHDVIEDAADGAEAERLIRVTLGDRVADIVVGCSDAVGRPDGVKPPWKARKQATLRHLATTGDSDALLVSACDKLHNSRCLLADLRERGDAVWARFNAPREDQIWYYHGLVRAFRGRIPAGLQDELERTVTQITTLAGPRQELG